MTEQFSDAEVSSDVSPDIHFLRGTVSDVEHCKNALKQRTEENGDVAAQKNLQCVVGLLLTIEKISCDSISYAHAARKQGSV
jgi:hypothetical protein